MRHWLRRSSDRAESTPAAPPPAHDGPGTAPGAEGERAINVAGDLVGIASTGDGAVNIVTQAERATVLPPEAFGPVTELPAPPGLVRLPLHTGHFVGRRRDLQRLDAALAGPGEVVVQAVHGLGGVGKSTLAVHWAAAHADEHQPIWWITAETPADLSSGLAALAVALQPALAGVLTDEALVERAVQWLAAHDGWLVILDNVTDPGDVRPLLTRIRRGRFLITSRRTTGWQGLATSLDLDVLAPAESVDLVSRLLDRPATHLDGVEDLCEELGHLPLAVEQAGSYIAETGITPRAYLDLLAAEPATMYRHGSEGTDAQRTIARIWKVTLERLTAEPLTATILRTLAWFAPDRIPRSLLTDLADEAQLTRAIGRLAAYGMLRTDPESATLSVHRLVQAVARTPEPDDPHRRADLIDFARGQATHCLGAALPEGWNEPEQWPTYRLLLAHVDALAHHSPPEADSETTVFLLDRAGSFHAHQGSASRAIGHHERVLAACIRLRGESHGMTLSARQHLARAYELAGELQRAIPLFEEAVKGRIELSGVLHPRTLSARNSLAHAYTSAGDVERAIRTYKHTLINCRTVLGEDDLETLHVRHNLAQAYTEAGHAERAVPLLEQCLAGLRRTLGTEHPDTLTARHNLVLAYETAGQGGEKVVALYEQLIADSVRVLGQEHRDTLATRHSLASAYAAAGSTERALATAERVLADRIRVLGREHPDTLSTHHLLAHTYKAAGDNERALATVERVLADRARVLGRGHPDTLATHHLLAKIFEAAGDNERAVSQYERTLDLSARVLGEDHPDTLTARSNRAWAHLLLGETGQAIALYEQTLADRLRVFGGDHISTLITRKNLAHACEAAGDVPRARMLLEENLPRYLRVLGDEHPDSLQAAQTLAFFYVEHGNVEGAVVLGERTLAVQARVLGEDHADTLITRDNLAVAHLDAGAAEQAMPLARHNLRARERLQGHDHPDTLNTRNNLAVICKAGGDLEQAVRLFEETLTAAVRVLGSDASFTARVRNHLVATRESERGSGVASSE